MPLPIFKTESLDAKDLEAFSKLSPQEFLNAAEKYTADYVDTAELYASHDIKDFDKPALDSVINLQIALEKKGLNRIAALLHVKERLGLSDEQAQQFDNYIKPVVESWEKLIALKAKALMQMPEPHGTVYRGAELELFNIVRYDPLINALKMSGQSLASIAQQSGQDDISGYAYLGSLADRFVIGIKEWETQFNQRDAAWAVRHHVNVDRNKLIEKILGDFESQGIDISAAQEKHNKYMSSARGKLERQANMEGGSTLPPK